jgi:hypothetical protein
MKTKKYIKYHRNKILESHISKNYNQNDKKFN